MGNYSKDPAAVLQEARLKGYERVRFQQGKPILDRELNLLGDLSSMERIGPYIGDGVPAQDPLWVDKPQDPAVVDFILMPGRGIVNGLEVVIPERVSYKQQPHKGNIKNAWPSFTTSPVNMGWVVLHVFLTEVDDTTDASLQNQSDIGFETSLRQKVDWELLLVDDSYNPNYLLLAEYTVEAKAVVPFILTWTDRRTLGLTLSQLRGEFDIFATYMKQITANLNPDGSFHQTSVTNQSLQDNSVSTTKIQDLAVTTNKLGNLSVNNAKLADLSVGTTKLADISVSTAKLQDLSVGTTKLADLSITNTKLQDNSISTLKLQANSVTDTRLQDNSVVNSKILNGAVTNAKIQDGAIDGNKLAVNSINSNHLQGFSVASANIQNGAVVYGKLGPASITVAQLKFLNYINSSFTIPANSFLSVNSIPKASMGPDNMLVFSIWGDGDYTWSDYVAGGNRVLRIQNNLATPIVINVIIRRIQES
jgi:hypothetical protein